MKKVIPFSKEIPFNRTIAEITDIEVNHDLQLKNYYEIEGNILVNGKYKMTSASQVEEEFDYKMPFTIEIDSKYDTSNLSISITDFTFEIINEEVLKVNVDVTLDNLIDKLDVTSIRNFEDEEVELLDEFMIDKEDTKEEKEKEKEEKKPIEEEKINTIFNNNEKSEYSTYYVYIFKDGDTLEYILDKYAITRDELESYNDLSSITIGSKIIIPCSNE